MYRLPLLYILFSLSLVSSSLASSTWYVSPSGTNTTANGNGRSPEDPIGSIGWAFNNAAHPGDTILVMEGVYRNGGFGSGNLNNGPVAYLNNSGEPDHPIVLKNYPGHRPVIEFDGAGGFTANNIRHIEISGFHIIGPGSRITEAEAMENRLESYNYYNGRGIAIWGPADNITITHNIVQDCPASGIRVNQGDYITITHNEVFRNTRYTSSAESAIVIADARSIDTEDTIKIRIENNLSYDNQNLIPFYTPNPPDVGIEDYGTEDQDYIIDGSGVYMTRNKDYDHGWFYLANNISFNNGINGLVIHRTDRAYVVNNTSYMNGATPLESGRQSSSGITLNNAEQVRVYNNISWARFEDDMVLGAFGDLEDILIDGNVLFVGNTPFTEGFIWGDPQFFVASTHPDIVDLWLKPDSPAVGAGVWNSFVPDTDFYGHARNASSPIDSGAIAFVERSSSHIETLPVASQIAEGQSLAWSALFGGEAKADAAHLPGKFYFEEREHIPANAGETDQAMVFIPEDRESYSPARGEVPVEVLSLDSKTPEKNVSISFYLEAGLSPAMEGVETFAELDLQDTDGDGTLNWQEFVAGTDPNDPQSVFRVTQTSRQSDGSVTLEWPGGTRGPTSAYLIERSSNLGQEPGGWVQVDTVSRQEGMHSWSSPVETGAKAFYRVRATTDD